VSIICDILVSCLPHENRDTIAVMLTRPRPHYKRSSEILFSKYFYTQF